MRTDHIVINGECSECNTKKCSCGGFVHEELIDASYDSLFYDYWCDKCLEELNEDEYQELEYNIQ